MIYFITGLPASGKTTSAKLLCEALPEAAWIDGDIFRSTLSRGVGYDTQGRVENIDRALEVTKMLHGRGCDVILSVVAPIAASRNKFRDYFGSEFIEIYLDKVIGQRPEHYYCKYEETNPHYVGISGFEDLLFIIEGMN